MDTNIKITRETEFYQGYIRFKMAVTNESPSVIMDVLLDFIFDDELLRIEKHEPLYIKKKEKILLGNINTEKSKSINIYFDPLTCSKATEINCQVTYKDYRGMLNYAFMEPKRIETVCPIMNTDHDINIGRLKEFIEVLPSRDSRVYEVESGFNLNKLENLSCKVLQKRDVRHVRTLYTRDAKTCEIWYYGKTKVTKDDVVIKVSILAEHHTLELFAATQSAEALTGLLAEVGRELKDSIESNISGRGKILNVYTKDSVVQRSNLLDMCNMNGICDVNVIIDGSIVQHSNIYASTHNLEKQKEIVKNDTIDDEDLPLPSYMKEAIRIKKEEGFEKTSNKQELIHKKTGDSERKYREKEPLYNMNRSSTTPISDPLNTSMNIFQLLLAIVGYIIVAIIEIISFTIGVIMNFGIIILIIILLVIFLH